MTNQLDESTHLRLENSSLQTFTFSVLTPESSMKHSWKRRGGAIATLAYNP